MARREDVMSSLFTNLLFMHGHITDLELARRLADTPPSSVRPSGKRERVAKVRETRRKVASSPAALAHGGCA
jgi:hypothetical protein